MTPALHTCPHCEHSGGVAYDVLSDLSPKCRAHEAPTPAPAEATVQPVTYEWAVSLVADYAEGRASFASWSEVLEQLKLIHLGLSATRASRDAEADRLRAEVATIERTTRRSVMLWLARRRLWLRREIERGGSSVLREEMDKLAYYVEQLGRRRDLGDHAWLYETDADRREAEGLVEGLLITDAELAQAAGLPR